MSVLRLEQHRRKSGVSLEAIAERTKISTRFLRAIESEEFDKLPGGVFNTSYIRQYAACIHFPEEKLLAAYHARVEAEAVDLATMERQVSERPRSSRRGWLSWFRTPEPAERSS